MEKHLGSDKEKKVSTKSFTPYHRHGYFQGYFQLYQAFLFSLQLPSHLLPTHRRFFIKTTTFPLPSFVLRFLVLDTSNFLFMTTPSRIPIVVQDLHLIYDLFNCSIPLHLRQHWQLSGQYDIFSLHILRPQQHLTFNIIQMFHSFTYSITPSWPLATSSVTIITYQLCLNFMYSYIR